MATDKKYGGHSADPLAALEKRQYVTAKSLEKGLKASLDAIKARIASAKTPAFADSQKKLFDEISAAYAKFAASADKYLKDEVAAAAALGGKAAQNDAAGQDLVRWSEARCRRYWMYVNPQSGKNLAAVYTEKMAENSILALRQAVVDVTRRAAIEGMPLKAQHKAIQEAWGEIIADGSTFQFVDRSGKAWDTGQYLQMLSRTTAQRVYRDSYADRLAESGFQLVRITSLGAADCPVCKAWQGVICTLGKDGGKYPTVEQARAAGVWHPNCMCSMEYVDEDLDEEDIKAQADAGTVDWSDEEAVQKRSDDIAVEKFKAEGMDEGEALDALTRAKLEEAIRTGLFAENSEDLAAGFTHEQLVEFRENGIPDFALAKKGEEIGFHHGSAGGVVRIDRKDIDGGMESVFGVDVSEATERRKAEEEERAAARKAEDEAKKRESDLAAKIEAAKTAAAETVRTAADTLRSACTAVEADVASLVSSGDFAAARKRLDAIRDAREKLRTALESAARSVADAEKEAA